MSKIFQAHRNITLTEEIINFLNFVGHLVCHQRQERSLWIGGNYLPVCARCTGVYMGLLLGYALLPFLSKKKAKGPPNLYLSLLMSLPLFIDSSGQAFGFWISMNELRLATGLIFGVALAPFLVYVLSLPPFKDEILLIKRIQPEIAVLDEKDSWFGTRPLILSIMLSGILFLMISSLSGSGFPLFYWMISIPVIAIIMFHFFVLPVLLLGILLKNLVHSKKGE